MHLASGTGWELKDYGSLAALLLGVALLVYLLYVPHHDGQFWEEEEAARATPERGELVEECWPMVGR